MSLNTGFLAIAAITIFLAMDSFRGAFVLFIVLFMTHYTINAQNGLTLPVRKDAKTSQFYTTLQMGSNRASINTVIDLGAPYLWFACNDYVSNTFSPIPCGSQQCDVAGGIGCFGCNLTPRPGCSNDTCSSAPYNPFLDVLVSQGFGKDTLQTKDGAKLTDFSFSCMEKDYLQGLASGTIGMLGLARTRISLHRQAADKLRLSDKFSLCLSPSGLGKLSIPPPKTEVSLKSTALIVNPVSTYPIFVTGDPSDEYFIDVKSIRVAGKPLSLKSSYFSIDAEGVGGTKISTIRNFTALHNSIYKPFTRAFVKAASDMKIKSVAAVAPFRACFDSASISKTKSGPAAPSIDLVLPGEDVYWRISGGNSLVEINKKVTCLGFVDGGKTPRTSIVIGAHQLEDNLLEFDLVSSKLRFSSSLPLQNRTCSRL